MIIFSVFGFMNVKNYRLYKIQITKCTHHGFLDWRSGIIFIAREIKIVITRASACVVCTLLTVNKEINLMISWFVQEAYDSSSDDIDLLTRFRIGKKSHVFDLHFRKSIILFMILIVVCPILHCEFSTVI